ncbi:TerC family protein [Leeia sp. TBRC 13508]|uniref:TerC family protein n=1 Tax=Leeia speluncae TaxID=2884804 RepID=A0ABS8D7V4_9NEIS|nr:TerC family protein [Leeia speluncae]MCB6183723.1 TerC family protein [Leeia speluncae]
MQTIGNNPLLWIVFLVIIAVMIAIDMLAMKNQGAHKISTKEALTWSAVWFSIALLFNLGLWIYLDQTATREVANDVSLAFFTGYLIEKALAIDNIFVFLMIFSYFSVPAQYQRRVLVYGVLGAIIMRAVMIVLGSALISRFHWVLYIFGAFLVFTAIKMWFSSEEKEDLGNNGLLKWVKKHIRLTDEFAEEKFFIVKNGIRYGTPLLLVLIMIELSDLIFAVDSIPAIFAVTTDPFIVFTSNIFAILGLRAMYFLLADMADRFHLLKFGLALVLGFIGVKMLVVEFWKIPVGVSLGVVFLLIAGSVVLSLYRPVKATEVK